MSWHADIRFSDLGRGAELLLARERDGGLSQVVAVRLKDVADGERLGDGIPFARRSEAVSFLQAMMDLAFEHGLRPSRAQDERHMKAHLDDMRKIAFHTLGVDK